MRLGAKIGVAWMSAHTPSLLLDKYSGAAAAYSLRLLRNDYSGNAVRVRRGSDNQEQNIGFVNNVLDTATMESFVNSGEVFTNPEITSATGWDLSSNTEYNSETEAFDMVEENGLTIQQGVNISGHTYSITIVVDSISSGRIKIYAGGTQSDEISTTGTHTLDIVGGSSNDFLGVNPVGTATCSISSFSAIDTTANGYVTTWYDQSGSGNNATQITASRQPKIVNAGSTITYLSKPSILYNGTSQYIQNSLSAYSSSEQYYIVGEGFTDNGRGAQTIRGGSFWRDGSVFRFINGGNMFFTTGSTANNLLVVQLNASDADLYLNNVAATESGSFSPTYNTTSLIGGAPSVGTYHDSFISEYIVWGNTDNRNEKQTNINDYYSIY